MPVLQEGPRRRSVKVGARNRSTWFGTTFAPERLLPKKRIISKAKVKAEEEIEKIVDRPRTRLAAKEEEVKRKRKTPVIVISERGSQSNRVWEEEGEEAPLKKVKMLDDSGGLSANKATDDEGNKTLPIGFGLGMIGRWGLRCLVLQKLPYSATLPYS